MNGTSYPLVSIVIPCWNSEETIGDAIQSAINQKYERIEIIVVDDGSSDNSMDVIRSFGERIEWISDNHKGACAARNTGIALSSGEYFQFLDADDYLLRQKVAHQVEILMETGATFVAGSYARADSYTEFKTRTVLQCTDPWTALLNGRSSLGNTCSNLWSAAGIKEIGGWNVEWQSSQEAELMFRLLREGAKVAWDFEPLTVVRSRETSISNVSGLSLKPSAWRNWVKIREQIVEYLATRGELNEDRLAAFQRTLIRLARNYRRQDGGEACRVVRRNGARMKSLRMLKGHFLYGLIFDVFGFEIAERCRDVYGQIRAHTIPHEATSSGAG